MKIKFDDECKDFAYHGWYVKASRNKLVELFGGTNDMHELCLKYEDNYDTYRFVLKTFDDVSSETVVDWSIFHNCAISKIYNELSNSGLEVKSDNFD